MRARLVVVVALALAASPACLVRVDYGDSTYLCEDGKCPDGEPCVEGVCNGQPAADAAPDAQPVNPRIDDELIGDRLFLSFNDNTDFNLFRDGSRARRDAFHSNATSVRPAGKFGAAVDPSLLRVVVPDTAELFPDPSGVTIEAWVASNGGFPVLFGDADTIITVDDSWLPTTTEMAVYLGNPGGVSSLFFAVMDQCGGSVLAARVPFTLDGLVHVAVVWDRSEVRFYKDGALAGTPQPLVADGCELSRNYIVGRTIDNTSLLDGFIDELKVSAGTKTESEIGLSMAFDSAANGADCGDFALEAAEDCDSDSMCCDQSSCRLATSGSTCTGGTCDQGLCRVPAGRSNLGLLALYDFDDPMGATVLSDTSGIAPALDLTISDPVGTLLKSSTLSISAQGIDIASAADSSKITSAVAATGELSLEAWVQPSNTTQAGPARIVSLSLDTGNRSAMLGQVEDAYVGRIRTTRTNTNGVPEVPTPRGLVVTTEPTHLVLTRDSSGTRRLWVNGVLVEQSRVGGALTWDPTYPLHIGNEGGGLRSFEGTFHLIAIYDTAMGEARVAAHYLAGPQ